MGGRPFTKLNPRKIKEITKRLELYVANRPKRIATEYGVSVRYIQKLCTKR